MKSLFKFVIVLLIAGPLQAQEIPLIKVGKEKLGITSLDIKVEVVGNIATTTYDMLFYNPKREVLEGELAFPLSEGQNVSRLALEVNGKLREAVVVEKEQGRVAFEAVVRRGVDPILLEKGTGNNYKARIYPIPARGHKRVVLAYEQELTFSQEAHYFILPLGFNNVLDDFSLEMNVFDQAIEPSINTGALENFQFNKVYSGYNAKFTKKNYQPKEALTIKIPQDYDNQKIISASDYFYVYKNLKEEKRERPKANIITLYWDSSLSMQKRNIDKEMNLLDDYLKYLGDVEVHLKKFSNQVLFQKRFKVKNGDWKNLRDELVETTYDGGTSFSNMFMEDVSDEVLLFSDGMKNLSHIVVNTSKPIYVINSLLKGNHSELKILCNETNGKYINLTTKSEKEGFEKLVYQSFKYLGYVSENKDLEVYPNRPTTVYSDFSITGKNFKEGNKMVLQFGFGNTVTKEETIILDAKTNNDLVKRIWAQEKLDFLEESVDINKEKIIEHSKTYNLVSNHTSLIVLETVWDYVRYKIPPPEELLEEYTKILNRNKGKQIVSATKPEEQEQTPDETTIENVNSLSVVNSNFGSIRGTIVDGSGLPLPGVNVIIKGTTVGTQTDFDGNYSINAGSGSELVFSYVGYTTLETTLGSSNIVNITMQDDVATLDEVVVTAQGIAREKRVLGYAVSEVRADAIERSGESDVSRALSGKASGVQITNQSGTSGSGTNVIIRGYNSINGSNQPLFIVDGVPFSSDTNTRGNFINGNIGSSRFLDLDPNNIEKITVLKGLAAATIYGSSGRNGVILITTKAGATFNSRGNSTNSTNDKKIKNIYKGRLKVRKLIQERHI